MMKCSTTGGPLQGLRLGSSGATAGAKGDICFCYTEERLYNQGDGEMAEWLKAAVC
jgi:hypothetical protein